MYRYQDTAFNGTPSVRPVSSLSSGSADSGVFTLPRQHSGPHSRPVSGPPSPGLQINHLLHQTASLLAVNAQLRKEIEHVRSGAVAPSDFFNPPPEVFPFEPQQQNFQQNGRLQASGGKKSPKPDSYKTVMCQAWLESKICTFAENCRFAHGESELRPSRIQPKQNSKYKTKLCDKYTTTGLCPYGTRCLFIHPDNGSNAYIRPDKLVEVSQRHATADMCGSASHQEQLTRPVTPFGMAPPPPLGPTPCRGSSVLGSIGAHLRPHPSWPLEPAAFYTHKDENDTGSMLMFQQGLANELFNNATPQRVSLVSSGYASGGSSPAEEASPFSTATSSLDLNVLREDDADFDFFRLSGLDNLAEELTRNLELW